MAKKFIVSTESLEIAFEAGFNDAAHTSVTVDALVAVLAPFSGAADKDAVYSWEEVRKAFVSGLEAGGMNNATARKRWSRIVADTCLIKPQTPEAKAKAKARASEKPAAAAPAADNVTDVTMAKPEASVAASARLTACIELLQTLDADALVKAQAALLKLVESEEAPF